MKVSGMECSGIGCTCLHGHDAFRPVVIHVYISVGERAVPLTNSIPFAKHYSSSAFGHWKLSLLPILLLTDANTVETCSLDGNMREHFTQRLRNVSLVWWDESCATITVESMKEMIERIERDALTGGYEGARNEREFLL
ncbi:hypothetical protein PsorP6_004935 [Peronosclerospora sorghi]|uniref:Uncharacterized protein n=1 Tax=Peronosclerospora sorghi TaxID=230839 RepID=A0ACC0W4V1_9STRA|nr:hypothetical protein PsorP6_004935 [Peronosclerospora sorghi]